MHRFLKHLKPFMKKEFILTDGAGTYTLTKKGYKRLIDIRKNYDPEKENPIGPSGIALKALYNLDEKTRKKVIENLLKGNKNNKKPKE